MKKVIWAAAALCAFSGAAQAGEVLSKAQVRDLFPGSYRVTVLGTYEVQVTMRSNGTLSGESEGERDAGRWSIESGRLCIQWNSWNNGRKDCSVLQRNGNRVVGRGFWFTAA